jgi:hypothetical protein
MGSLSYSTGLYALSSRLCGEPLDPGGTAPGTGLWLAPGKDRIYYRLHGLSCPVDYHPLYPPGQILILIFLVLDRNVWVNTRNEKPLDRIYRMNRISKINLLKDPVNPVNPVILSKKCFFFFFFL